MTGRVRCGYRTRPVFYPDFGYSDGSDRTRPESGPDASDIWTQGERLSESDRTLAQWSDRMLMSFCSALGQSDIADIGL